MNDCKQARRLFGAYWDDEATQAEREWLDTHMGSCATCRGEYESLASTLECVGSLPRHEASPDLLERTLARTRRSVPVPDRVWVPRRSWVPATAAAALLIAATAVVTQWVGLGVGTRVAHTQRSDDLREPVLVGAMATRAPASSQPGGASSASDVPPADLFSSNAVGTPRDTLFDHREDVEFILDPVTVNRGRATVTRLPNDVRGQQAVITF